MRIQIALPFRTGRKCCGRRSSLWTILESRGIRPDPPPAGRLGQASRRPPSRGGRNIVGCLACQQAEAAHAQRSCKIATLGRPLDGTAQIPVRQHTTLQPEPDPWNIPASWSRRLGLCNAFHVGGVPERGMVATTSDPLFPRPQVVQATAVAGNRSLPPPTGGGCLGGLARPPRQ